MITGRYNYINTFLWNFMNEGILQEVFPLENP